MKPLKCLDRSGRNQGFTPPAVRASTAAALFVFLHGLSWAGGTVTNCTEADLRMAMDSGGTVTFGCEGAIVLNGPILITTNTILDGSGQQITISGNNTCRVFYVGTNVDFAVSNLTIANGRSDSGAGIYNNGGNVSAADCNFVGNFALGAQGYGLTNGAPGQTVYGGAFYNAGTAILYDCLFISNSAVGGTGSSGWIYDYFVGLSGGAGGDAGGGAIGNSGSLIMTGCLLANNSANGGLGGTGGAGQYSYYYGVGGPGGWGGAGGNGNGGAVFNNGSLILVNDTIALNLGAGGQGGSGGGGGPALNPDYPSGSGGGGGNGGSGYGAIYDVNGISYLTNCTLALNLTTNGPGGYGGGNGGGRHPGNNGANGANGAAGSSVKTTGTHLVNTLLSGNTPVNCIGTIVDAGHNLSSDGSCAFSNIGSLNNTDPKLGPLADNGGPTLTMALLPGSPAINAGDPLAAPATDQRGVPRPQGPGVDIGAFEYQGSYVPVFIGAAFQNPTNFWLRLSGLLPARAVTIQASTNLLDWKDVTNFVTGEAPVYEFIDGNLGNLPTRFYRLKVLGP